MKEIERISDANGQPVAGNLTPDVLAGHIWA
jgi:hypothetical protein